VRILNNLFTILKNNEEKSAFNEANLRLRIDFNLRDASREIEYIIYKIRLNSLYECHYRSWSIEYRFNFVRTPTLALNFSGLSRVLSTISTLYFPGCFSYPSFFSPPPFMHSIVRLDALKLLFTPGDLSIRATE